MTQLTEASSPAEVSNVRQALSRRDLLATIVAAYSFAVSLPLVDLLRQDVAFFVVRSSPAVDYVVFFATVVLFVPAALSAFVTILPLSWRPAAHSVLFGGLSALLALRLEARVPFVDQVHPIIAAAIAIAFGVSAVLGMRRWDWVRQLCRLGAFLPLVLGALFFGSGSVRAVMAPPPSTGATTVTSPQTVVFIIFDELPLVSLMEADGTLNEVRYPGFARLSEHTTWFRNASTASGSTIDAVPSLLTGRYPAPGGEAVPTISAHPQNLFTMLSSTHDTVAVEPITRLCPPAECGDVRREPPLRRLKVLATDIGVVSLHTLLPTSLTSGLPPIDENWGYFTSSEGNRSEFQEGITPLLRSARFASFQNFVRMIEADVSPTLYFIHSLLPHRPWSHIPNGDTYLQIERVPGISSGVWDDKEWLVDQGLQRHLLQVGAADTLVLRLLERLDELGALGEVILVVTADHGAAFQPGERVRGMSDATLSSLVPVPLFITIPGAEGTISDEPVELVDVVPTLAEILDADTSAWTFDGLSLIEPKRDRQRTVVAGGQFSLDDLERRRDQTILSLDRRVPMSGDWNALFETGLGKDMLGSDLSDLAVVEPVGWTAYIDDLADHREADLDPLPLMVTGYLKGNSPGVPVDLAIAVNGRVSAVTRTFDQVRGSMFSALTRLEDLTEGQRDLSVFVVEDLGSKETLAPLAVAAAG